MEGKAYLYFTVFLGSVPPDSTPVCLRLLPQDKKMRVTMHTLQEN